MDRSPPFALIALAFALAGCGYRFAAGGGPLPENVTAVRAPVFVNHTAEPGLEAVFTRALREQLMHAGVRADPAAEAELRGEVLAVGGGATILTTPLPGGAEPRLASYRIFATAKLKLMKGERVLAETDVTGSEDYPPGFEDILRSESNRQAALHRLAQRLMRDGYDRLIAR
ncbi:MAG TPA: LPS assembly lipoprotein LptE [Myxococcaceae bacterium]|nr:LPS assembly lipoprotein LptE [Myxococcaceae bacterium]HZA50398.1 LPS assembly lipoprotein LptE [Myxococcaceae bacterium]